VFDELDFYEELGEEIAEESAELDSSMEWIKESKLFLVSNIEHLRDIFSRIPDNAEVAHDTETTSLDVGTAKLVGISMAYNDPLDGPQGFYIPVGHSVDAHLNLDMQETLDEVIKLGNRVKYIFFNAKYDLGIYKYRNIVFPNKEDAMVSVFCYDTGYKALGLKSSSKRFLNQSMIEITDLFKKKEEARVQEEYDRDLAEYNKNLADFEEATIQYEQAKAAKIKTIKPTKKKFGCDKVPALPVVKISANDLDFSSLPALESYVYAASDALQTLKIYQLLTPVRLTDKEATEQFPLIKAAGQSFIHRVENKLIDALLDMECNKVRIDVDYIRRLAPFVIDDIYQTMVEVYRDLRLPFDFGSRSDFFYRMMQIPVKVSFSVEEVVKAKDGTIKSLVGNINSNPCTVDVKGNLNGGTYKASYSEGFLQNAKVTLLNVPELSDSLTYFDAELLFPEKSEFFLDSPIKVGHLLFTPKDVEIDFYTGIPLDSYSAEVSVGFADQVKTQIVPVRGLRDKLADKYDEGEIYRIKGWGVRGGKVTVKAGQWQTDDKTLTPLASQSKVIETVLRYRKKKKNLSTYISPFYNMKPAEDGNYYAKFAFRSMAAPSGRFAAGDKEGAGYAGVNAQAIPSNDGAFWVDAKRVFSR